MANSFCAESALALTTRKPTIDHFSKTITASESFMRAAMHAENGECAYLRMLRENCPGYTFVRSKSHKPSKGQKKITYIKEAFWLEYDGEPGSEIRSAAIACILGKEE